MRALRLKRPALIGVVGDGQHQQHLGGGQADVRNRLTQEGGHRPRIGAAVDLRQPGRGLLQAAPGQQPDQRHLGQRAAKPDQRLHREQPLEPVDRVQRVEVQHRLEAEDAALGEADADAQHRQHQSNGGRCSAARSSPALPSALLRPQQVHVLGPARGAQIA